MTKTDNPILDKSFQFGLRIVKLSLYLKKKNVERVLVNQLLRSGTSIGANVEEAVGAASKKDFINKLTVAYKEARETKYWLRILKESGLAEQKLADSFISECEELIRLLTAILNSPKQKDIINS